jgi:hypothetical protein
MMTRISRREFLKLSGTTIAGATLLGSGCSAQPATPAIVPTDTPAVTPTVAPIPISQLTGKVVHTHHAGAWNGEILNPEALGRMLDASITNLTGLEDVRSAWASLFRSNERIGIKVNSFYNSLIWTHVPLVTAVTDRLLAAGIPAEQITIFDQTSGELTTAGFSVNQDGAGIRCHGSDSKFTTSVAVASANVKLTDILLSVDALINMPVLKSHMLSGLTFALKNHYGSVDLPGYLHNVVTCIPALNALPAIKDRTRLVIGDMLTACLSYGYSYPFWTPDYTGDSILLSTDPVAHDAAGLQWLVRLMEEKGISSSFVQAMATPWLQRSADLGLGTADLEKIQLTELNLG